MANTKKSREAYLPDFLSESNLDYTSPYPCGVCGRSFSSRNSLATHKHGVPKRERKKKR